MFWILIDSNHAHGILACFLIIFITFAYEKKGDWENKKWNLSSERRRQKASPGTANKGQGSGDRS